MKYKLQMRHLLKKSLKTSNEEG